MENINLIYEVVKKIVSSKKTKVTLYLAAVLWLAVITQLAMNKFLKEGIQITQAFVNTNSEDLKSSLEFIAEYHDDFLSETDKKGIIRHIADAIGLTMDQDITVLRDEDRVEYEFYKKAKNATTQLKLVSLETKVDSTIQIKHYLIVRLTIKDSMHSTDRYREIIEHTMDDLGIHDRQVTIQYEGSFVGVLTKKEKDKIATGLVEELQGSVAMKYDTNGIYTVYAYTGLFHEYIVSMGSKVNIQIAISYDETKDKSIVKLATPIINSNW